MPLSAGGAHGIRQDVDDGITAVQYNRKLLTVRTGSEVRLIHSRCCFLACTQTASEVRTQRSAEALLRAGLRTAEYTY
jgi:hypothetical protein